MSFDFSVMVYFDDNSSHPSGAAHGSIVGVRRLEDWVLIFSEDILVRKKMS